MMRIVVPALDADCPAALALIGEGVEHELALLEDDFAYARLLDQLWRDGESFCIVEHDITPWPGALAALTACSQSWCGYCYPLGTNIGGSLGCFRVTADLTSAWPRLSAWWKGEPWYSLDGHFIAALNSIGLADYHVHEPPVAHCTRHARFESPRHRVPTADRQVFIETRWPGYIRYWREDGRRWELHGQCDYCGECMIGAMYDGEAVSSQSHLDRLQREGRADLSLDMPVMPELKASCLHDGRLRAFELEPGPYQP